MLLSEKLLSYIWQFQHFSRESLAISTGEKLVILHPGYINSGQGPDFSNGSIEINGIRFVGHIELHLCCSDWYRHKHQFDQNYSSVILHVVWENDMTAEPTPIPILELKNRVPKLLLEKYQYFMSMGTTLPCTPEYSKIKPLVLEKWKERLLAERLQKKGESIRKLKYTDRITWEEAAWRMTAKYFGGTVNGEAFRIMAEKLETKVIVRYRTQIHRLEALLLGTAGLLNGSYQEHYPVMLQKEYSLLRKRHDLRQVMAPMHFLRMRPSGFPTIRLSQLAALIDQTAGWINLFTRIIDLNVLKKQLRVRANDYWNDHYLFDKPASYRIKYTGKDFIDNLIINIVIPLRFALSQEVGDTALMAQTLEWIQTIPPEQIQAIESFSDWGIKPGHAGDTQALLQLKNEYCDRKRCLDCVIGVHILKSQS